VLFVSPVRRGFRVSDGPSETSQNVSKLASTFPD
jgi:hypothetical protein